MYVRKVDQQTLTLQVSGKLWMRSLVMSDVETGSEWAHLLGRAMAGPLKGKKLTPLVTDMMTWKSWKQKYPQTTAMQLSRTSRDFSRSFYDKNPDRFVAGFSLRDQDFAIAMTDLQRVQVHQFEAAGVPLLAAYTSASTGIQLFEPQIERQQLSFTAQGDVQMKDAETNSIWSRLSGECLAGQLKGSKLRPRVAIMSFKTAWKNFHPEYTLIRIDQQ